MPLIWTKRLYMGIEIIDKQHKELFDTINVLRLAVKESRGTEHVAPTIEFLKVFIDNHFPTEEEYMDNYKYPELALHKVQHDEFRDNVGRFEKMLSDKGPDDGLMFSLNNMLYEWWVNHIKSTDMKFRDFVCAERDT